MIDNIEKSQRARRENLAVWRANRNHELTLPSGLVVLVRDASVMDLVINGNIPQTLMGMIVDAANSDGKVDLSKFSSDNGFGALLTEITKMCVVDPPLADIGDDDHIGLDEISGADRMAIFQHANREVEQVKSFRNE